VTNVGERRGHAREEGEERGVMKPPGKEKERKKKSLRHVHENTTAKINGEGVKKKKRGSLTTSSEKQGEGGHKKGRGSRIWEGGGFMVGIHQNCLHSRRTVGSIFGLGLGRRVPRRE